VDTASEDADDVVLAKALEVQKEEGYPRRLVVSMDRASKHYALTM